MAVPKKYMLKSSKGIEALFAHGERVKAYPVHMVFRELEEPVDEGFKVVFSAPKRIHRSAVTRNRLKRLMREAFRPFISELVTLMENNGRSIHMMLIYVGRDEVPVHELQGKIKILLGRLTESTQSPSDEQTPETPRRS